jgi:hypothetical protein
MSGLFSFLAGIWQEALAAVIMLLIGFIWGKWKDIKAWKNKTFKNRIMLSLNTITPVDHKYKLQLRTLMEKDINEFMQNNHMANIVKKATKNTVPGKPLLIFPEKDAWYLLNAVLNQIAYQFADGLIKKDMGCNVTSQWYTFCFTFEKEGDIQTHKVRIMIIQREVLKNFPDESAEFILESDKHNVRIQTLRTLSAELKEHPHCFMDVEICQ